MENAKEGATVISVIVPCYGEDAGRLWENILLNIGRASSPDSLELVVVDAGRNAPAGSTLGEFSSRFPSYNVVCNSVGSLVITDYTVGGGRGPSLNAGAAIATSPLLTFLHSDTLLPPGWDSSVETTLLTQGVSSCAFNFGVRRDGRGAVPRGIRAVEITANLRTRLFGLPYGDQCISISRGMFDFVGGFPGNPLMEDYDLVELLRRRSGVMGAGRERLAIIGGEPARCDVRRWRKLGVWKTTITNSVIVGRYKSGEDPRGLFKEYYGIECGEGGEGDVVEKLCAALE